MTQALLNFLSALGGLYVAGFFLVGLISLPMTEDFHQSVGLAVFWPLAIPRWAWRGFNAFFES